MKIRLKTKEVSVIILYIISVVCYFVCVDIFTLQSGDLDNLRYIVFAIAIAHGFLLLFLRGALSNFKYRNFGNEMIYVFVVVMVFYFLSVRQANEVGYSIGTRTYIQLALILIPVMYAYVLINLLSIKTIIGLFEVGLYINMFFYIFFEIGVDIFFDLESYQSINFITFKSPFETISNSETFLMFFVFFYFFKNSAIDKKTKNKYCTLMVLSFLFTFLSFKRLAIIFALCVILLGRMIDLKGELPKCVTLITSVFFTVLTYFYTLFVKGELFSSVDVYSFTTGRDYILSLWEKKGYLSYGYGSSYELIGRYLEMDLVQIYLEIGLVAVFVFSYAYFKIARVNVFAYIIMLYEFFNLLTASSLPFSLGWIYLLICVSCISTEKIDMEHVIVKEKRGKVKKLFARKG
ncbi:MAG: hypothetical protein E7264_06015 [Lachnospiraceae bacterium]|nr:hypothetical protein [Lachnospiraceae bacterium]